MGSVVFVICQCVAKVASFHFESLKYFADRGSLQWMWFSLALQNMFVLYFHWFQFLLLCPQKYSAMQNS